MYRGEIFAYPLYLQKELHATENIRFFAMDVACKYWPYLEKVAGVVSSLQGLLDMKPFLSIMHARAHATKCEIKWSGRNQSGAGTTAGEEVGQVNSFLSRCALTTKYMSKSARVDMLTVHAIVWNRYKGETSPGPLHKICEEKTSTTNPDLRALQQSIEGLHMSVHARKQSLYRQNDSNKLRHRLRSRLAEDKRRLFEQVSKYNGMVPEDVNINVAVLEGSLAGSSAESLLWPWGVLCNDVQYLFALKKRMHDQHMLTTRLQEERTILICEMAQHCTWMKNLSTVLSTKIAEEGEENNGLRCLLQLRLSEAEGKLQLVLQYYKAAVGQQAFLLGDVGEEEECDRMGSDEESEEDEAEEDVSC
ncbi:uncharacterized protein LOC134031008 [Osmerus eperlanus]|uniref:uncharacterized protein LOC134031008 n=1 Tax=Osmerus eperlanus TaxID=29151 RepID=UPI002E15D388